MIKQCSDIRNLHKAVKTLWRIVEQDNTNRARHGFSIDWSQGKSGE
jgi:hypothetical protein